MRTEDAQWPHNGKHLLSREWENREEEMEWSVLEERKAAAQNRGT